MAKRIDITGQCFGRLTAIAYHGPSTQGALWRFRCDCGNEIVTIAKVVRFGRTRSCGCFARAAHAELGRKNRTHGMTDAPEYTSWTAMRGRCNNPADTSYQEYGAKGVSVCERWNSFENFLADMGPRQAGTTLDRYPNRVGNYEPANCRWATAKQQTDNRSTTRWIEAFGRVLPIADWAREIGVPGATLRRRLNRGVPPEEALKENAR